MVAPSHLKSFQALEAALRLGSLKAAAAALAITPAAVGQRIKVLEEFLGVDLLVRGRSGLSATPALDPAVARLREAFTALQSAADALELQRGYEIHVAAPSDFVELWLKPRLNLFRAERPNTRFCINGEGDAPLRLGVSDCEISFGAVQPSGSQELLFRDYVAPIASPENQARIATAPREDRLEGFPLLHLDFYRNDPAAPDWAEWIAVHGLRRTAPERGIRFERIVPALDAVLADAGLTLCGLALIQPLLHDGRVVLPFGPASASQTSHAFLARFRQPNASRPHLREFRAWLIDQARQTEAWLTASTA
jgi:LysR family glycine cleavage system transcriptional activator